MHEAARDYIASFAGQLCFVETILEVGGRDINGNLRDLWPNAEWTSVDLYKGPGVDVVADFCEYVHHEPVDLVICAEVFEHTAKWPQIIESAAQNLKTHGIMLITTATGNRKPHSGIDGNELREGEFYGNIAPKSLKKVLEYYFRDVEIDVKKADLRARAQTQALFDCTCGVIGLTGDEMLEHSCNYIRERVIQ